MSTPCQRTVNNLPTTPPQNREKSGAKIMPALDTRPLNTTSDITSDTTSDITAESATGESTTPAKGRARKSYNNKAFIVNLDIDAGAKNIKARFNGEYKVFPSIAKVIKDEVTLRDAGCFMHGKKNYVVGNAINRVNGEVIKASDNKKLEHLEIWILGAITHFRRQLKQAVMSRKRKTEPVFLQVNLRILTLSSLKRKELEKTIKALSSFTWDDEQFTIAIKSLEFKDEAYGAALEVAHTEKIESFKLLDMGGGTLTYSDCEWDGYEILIRQQPISGGGMVRVMNSIFTALARTDRGAISSESEDIQMALEASTIDNSEWLVPLALNGKFENIADEVLGALSEWVSKNHNIMSMLDRIRHDLRKGEFVYCTGGGFAIKVVAEWVRDYLSSDIPNAQIKILESPEKINIIGLRWIDEVENSKSN